MQQAIEKAGYTGKIKIGMDVAASEFCKKDNGVVKYDLDFKSADSKPADWVGRCIHDLIELRFKLVQIPIRIICLF